MLEQMTCFADKDTEITTKIQVRKARVFRAVRNAAWTIEALSSK